MLLLLLLSGATLHRHDQTMPDRPPQRCSPGDNPAHNLAHWAAAF